MGDRKGVQPIQKPVPLFSKVIFWNRKRKKTEVKWLTEVHW